MRIEHNVPSGKSIYSVIRPCWVRWGVAILSVLGCVGCFLGAICARFENTHDILVSLGTGLVVYVLTVLTPWFVRVHKGKRLLRRRYALLKRNVIGMLLAPLDRCYDPHLIEELLDPTRFNDFINRWHSKHQTASDAIENWFQNNECAYDDFREELRLFFDSVITIMATTSVDIESFSRAADYASYRSRLQNTNLLNNDVKYITEWVLDLFSDSYYLDGSAIGFEHVINNI